MKRARLLILLITAGLLFSCNNDRNRSRARQQLLIPRQNTQYDSGFLSPNYANQRTTTQNFTLSQSFVTPIDSLAAQALAAGKQNTGQPFDTAAMLLARGLNPPHGAPGHRCELKVGEPLDPKPEIQTTKQVLNPAHGQPGHRCDIAVGAPLNTKPANNTTQSSIVQTNTSTANNTALKNGLNPAHGQPGHRCDIAVGAPLNSKPVTIAANQNLPVLTNKSIVADSIKIDSIKN